MIASKHWCAAARLDFEEARNRSTNSSSPMLSSLDWSSPAPEVCVPGMTPAPALKSSLRWARCNTHPRGAETPLKYDVCSAMFLTASVSRQPGFLDFRGEDKGMTEAA